MDRIGLTNRDAAARLGVSENAIGRAVNSTLASKTRTRVLALIEQLEAGAGSSSRVSEAARRLAQLVGDDRLVDARIQYIGDGKAQQLVALTVDSDLTPEEVERLVREWRESGND